MGLREARPDSRAAVEAVVARYGCDPDFLIPILQDLQVELGYLPREALEAVAQLIEVPLSQCFAVATFYSSFSLVPKGQHVITLCLGTVCYLKGGKQIAETIQRELDIVEGGTTGDGLFTYQPVNCLGACALAPVLVVDGEYYDKVKPASVMSILNKYRRRESSGRDG
jgi:NADH:ubiquinone oxidoreductase subunit E